MSDQAEPIGAEGDPMKRDMTQAVASGASLLTGSIATRTPDPKAAGVEREAVALVKMIASLAWSYGDNGEHEWDLSVADLVEGAKSALRAVDAAPGGGVTHSSRGNCPDCDGTGYEGGFSGNENSEAACHPCLGTGSTPTAAPAPNVQACTASPDHADILETIENAADDWQAKGYPSALAEVRDMANVGRSLMEALPEGYSYMNCPSEIVSDLQNERDEALAAIQAPAREGVEKCPECSRLVLADNVSGTGFMATCGRRLSSIDQCRPEGCATPPAGDRGQG